MNLYIPRRISGQSEDSERPSLPVWDKSDAVVRQKKSEKPSGPASELKYQHKPMVCFMSKNQTNKKQLELRVRKAGVHSLLAWGYSYAPSSAYPQ